MAQVTYGFNELFPGLKIEVPDKTISREELSDLQLGGYLEMFIPQVQSQALIPKSVTILGKRFESGMIVITSKPSFGKLTVGLIKAVAVNCDKVLFFCDMFIALQSKFNYYVTECKISDNLVGHFINLCDNTPLVKYGTSERFIFPLHHYISELT